MLDRDLAVRIAGEAQADSPTGTDLVPSIDKVPEFRPSQDPWAAVPPELGRLRRGR